MRREDLNLETLINEVFHKMAEHAVNNALADRAGWGISESIQAVVKEEARKVCQTPEIQKRMKEQLLSWIGRSEK